MIIAGKTPTDKKKLKDTTKKVAQKVVKKSGYFDDGYDFGDVTKTILSTTGDVASNVAKGFVSTVEGAVDTGRILLGDLTKKSANAQASIWELFGNDDYANRLRQAGQQVKDYEYKNAKMDVTGALLGETNDLFSNNWSQKLHEKSVAGDLTTSVFQGVGNMGAFVGLGAIGGGSPALTFTNSFTSAFGNTMTNALRNGVDEKDARGQAFTSGLAEAISEQFFQGIPGLKSAGWADDLISKPIGKYFSGKTGKIALKIFDSLGEGTEEVISNVLQATFEGIRNGKNVKDIFNDAKAQSFFNSPETREAFISALISSALTNGGSTLITNTQKNQVIKSYAQEHGITEQQTKQLFDSIVEKRANLEETKNFKERAEIEEGIGKQLRNEIKQDIKGENKLDLNELFEQTPNSRKEMQFRFNQDEAKNVKSEKQNVLANDMARLNDEKSNHELYKVVNAIQSANDTQQYHITTTEGLYEMGIVNKNENGEYTMPDGSPYVPRGLNYKNGEIYINADVGSQSGTQAVYHEMFEGFKKAAPEQYNQFKQMVTDIIGEENIQKEFDTYKSMYGEELTDDIRDEIINDKFGELAENQNFINKIADNRNVLEKFIDSIKNMIKYVKGTDQERQLMKLQKNLEKEFAKRYKETDFSQGEGDTAYSILKNKKEFNLGTYQENLSKTDKSYRYNKVYQYDIENGGRGDNVQVSVTPTGYVWNNAMLSDNIKGKGEGTKIALDLNQQSIEETGYPLRSLPEYNIVGTKNHTEEGKGLWDSLVRKGYAIKNDDNSYTMLDTAPTEQEYNNTRYSLTSNKDSQGRNLSPQQQEYFKDSKVVDEDGNLLEVYHGTKTKGFNIFNYDVNRQTGTDFGEAYYFTSDYNKAKGYQYDLTKDERVQEFERQHEQQLQKVRDNNFSKESRDEFLKWSEEHKIADILNDEEYIIKNADNIGGETKKVYLNLTNPLIVDAEGQNYYDVYPEYFKKARDNGNDGIIVKNVVDNPRGEQRPIDTYIAFNPNQIKNVDNTNPTDNPDIRFSLTPLNELDPKKEYYFRGQTNNEQKIAYNNTHFQGNTEGGVFVTPNRDTAEKYGKNVLAMEKTKDNTVSVEESDRLQEWASKIVQDDMNNLRESDYVIEQMALGRPRAFAEYTGKPFVETGDMFGEPGEAIYYQEVDDGTSTYRDNYSLTSNENIDSKEIAPVGSTIEETIAPIREDISSLNEKIDNLSTQLETTQNGVEMTSNEEIAPVNPYRERAIAQREANQAINEMQKDENYWKSLEQIANEEGMSALDDKSARKLSRNIGKELGLKQKQVKDLQNVINDAFNNGYSLDQIKEELENQFGHGTVTTKNEAAIEAQNEIKRFKIKVSPEIQKDIADYGYWKQQHFGKIKFSNEGDSVGSVYQQLNEIDAGMFPSDIINDTDQLLRIAEVADMDKKYSYDYEMTPETINEAANYIYDTFNETLYANAIKSANNLEENALQYNERTKDIPYKKRTRQEVREFLQSGMGITKQDLQQGNDIKSTQYNLDTPERVNEKVFGREVGRKINEQTVYFAKHQEAERIRFLNKERQEIADLGIKARSKESALVQQYGEGIIGDTELAQEVKDEATREKIKNAAKVLRSKYDTYLDQINEELVDMGYDPIPKRKDYMRHFQELTDKFSQAGIPFNRQDLNSENLPTDINGLTEFNVPGKNWFASANRRTGEKTTYDAITGIDGYLEGASNLMYHTETIQRYRALEKLIRDTYGQTHGLDEFNGDISSEDAMQRVQDIQNGKLSNYAAWIKEQGNAIAGKKGALDRGFERALGRRAYTLASTLKKQVGSNMTGFNVRSALTNFISSTIAAAKTNKLAMIRGTIDTIQNMFHDDGFINRSDFLTSRFGSDSLSQKTWQKISNAGQILMQGSDWFTSNLITRSKYYEGIQRGMTDTQAMNYANDFAARVMGDRSKGATAEAFNSKTLGFLTQFQLETNNQWQYMIHDTKMEYQENLAKEGGLKAGATVLFQVGQLAAYSYLFNEMFEKLTGSRAAFDPFDILKKLFGLDPDDKEKSFEERMKEAASELVDALPFASLFGSGGRLPISEMLTPFQSLYDYVTGGTNKYGNELTLKDVGKDTLESLPYYLLPTGYGQLKKAKQGLGMYNKNLPIPGSYTDSGNLRFTADTDTASVIKNALFGQWSGEEAKKYRESGYKTINAKDIPLMKDLGMTSSEFREFKTEMKEETTTTMEHEGVTYNLYLDDEGNRYWYDKNSKIVYDAYMNETDLSVMDLKKASANELKFDYVSNLPISEENKMKIFGDLFTNTTTDKYGYTKYTDNKGNTYWYDEENDTLYNNKYKQISKSSVEGLKEVSTSKDLSNYENYGSYAEFDYAYKNPAKYKTITAITNYDDYQKYKSALTTIRDNTKEDKKETIKYVNSLDLTVPQKAMMIKQYYPSFTNYNNEIVRYVNSLDISYDDKVEILKSLKINVDKNGNVSWK